MAAHPVLPSADCSMRPVQVLPSSNVPTCWTAKHGPSAEIRSTAAPVYAAVSVLGGSAANTATPAAKSLTCTDMVEAPCWAEWMICEGKCLAEVEEPTPQPPP